MKINFASLLSSFALMLMVMYVLHKKMNAQPPSATNMTNTEKTMVKLVYKMEKDDILQLFYRPKGLGYTEAASIRNPVKGNKDFQTAIFTLPEDAELFRLDINQNGQQSDIYFQELFIQKGKKQKKLNPVQMIQAFSKKNQFIKQLEEKNNLLHIHTAAINNQYDPYFWDIDINYLLHKIK